MKRTVVLFWASVAAAALFLGTAWAAAGKVGGHRAGAANLVVLIIAIIGFAVTAFIAGRIAFVVGRLQRASRRRR